MSGSRLIAVASLLGLAAVGGLATGAAAPFPEPAFLVSQVATETEAEDANERVEEEPKEKTELELMKEEQSKLAAEYGLLMQRQKNELAALDLEKQRMATEAALRSARQDQALAALRSEAARLQARGALEQAELDAELREAKALLARLSAQRQLEEASRKDALKEWVERAEELQAKNSVMSQQIKEAQLAANLVQQQSNRDLAEMKARLAERETKDKVRDTVLQELDYHENPHQRGTLYVSDRRISLNGPIWSGTADFVCDRIDYFNNQSADLPIFIVIDNSPGGSVMEGYRIVKAIETSPAPVHVVVKSFAASMAAVITTLAPHSYAYPNAIILHHQMSSGMSGNLTQQKEQLENGMEWARRLADPVARKMGVTYEQLVKQMYESNSDGDWEEFADRAQELKWVDHIVHSIREVGVRERPSEERPSLGFFFQAEEVDSDGRPFQRLPRLSPFDHYFLYNPDGYYRMR